MAMELWRPRSGLARRGGESFRTFDDLVGRVFDDWLAPRVAGETRGWSPAVDMIDRKDAIVLRADLPGLEQKDIQVNLEGGMLTIRGTREGEREAKDEDYYCCERWAGGFSREGEREAKDEDYYCCERWAGGFSRTMALPPGIDPEKIKATFKNGVLEVHVPKSPQSSGKSIEIRAA